MKQNIQENMIKIREIKAVTSCSTHKIDQQETVLKDLQISALKFKFPRYLKAIQTINTFEQTTTLVHTNKKKTKHQSSHRANGLAQH